MTRKPQNRYGFKFYGGLFVLAFGSIILMLAALAHGPDRDLLFVREVPSDVNPAALGRALDNVKGWDRWFHSTREVKLLDSEELKPGARLKFMIDPKKGPFKKLEVNAEVLRYEPGKLIRLRVLGDSKQRIDALFDRLEWEVSLVPASGQTIVRGEALAHTRHWRSRLFGQLTPRILMNQVFYPDLNSLAAIDGGGPPKGISPF